MWRVNLSQNLGSIVICRRWGFRPTSKQRNGDAKGMIINQLGSLILLILAMGLVVVLFGSVTKIRPAKTEPIRFRSMDTSSAICEVVGYTNGITNSKFGFPSGVFVEDKVEADRAIFREVVYGTVGLQAAKYSFMAPFKVVGRMYRAMKGNSKERGFLEMCLLILFCLLITVALPFSLLFVEVTLIEFVMKKSLRSKIEARAKVDPQNPNDVLVEFTLSGISARLTKAAITNAFVTPERPILMAKA